ncbi:MarR family transcriptional regulator [Kitasatospora sp. NBC_00240]|uniref:MarR family winged helix-turn-helix transcriptional regulator n=1 Tax=Kitasatospora sp. NBC_00240 TaxID=2903567 RepID=UPI0022502659|nr:MarR family transcriptional regulator [Kitasatospora sp. NBC_00240]MCX5211957.1 MarR family transcriptional regulator [Kitasatospora sp. NBC_00240]
MSDVSADGGAEARTEPRTETRAEGRSAARPGGAADAGAPAVPPVQASTVFRLGVLGAMATELFAAAVEPHGLKPKQVGLMIVLSEGLAASQLDVARVMGVAPSLVVGFADHLEGLGAIRRTRDPADRRRQLLTLTDHGRELLDTCSASAHTLDARFADGLTEQEHAVLTGLLGRLAAGRGLPTGR